MKAIRKFLVAAIACAVLAPIAFAQALVDGEVKDVNKAQGKIKLTHNEIKNLDLPAMTMSFRVKDKAMLDKVQAGDRVKFSAEKIGGQYTITAIQK
jgi:Cu(I)/Ag(I) efflux system periplasmic protein CusF